MEIFLPCQIFVIIFYISSSSQSAFSGPSTVTLTELLNKLRKEKKLLKINKFTKLNENDLE